MGKFITGIPKNLVQQTSIIFSLFLLTACAFLRESSRMAFLWPLNRYTLTQKFSAVKRPPHLGIDLKAPIGSPVLSSHSGRVVYAGRKLTGFGNVIILEYSPYWASLYAHLQEIKVKTGQKVNPGDVIGALGNTGRTSGPHLHFELIYKGKTVDPLIHLP